MEYFGVKGRSGGGLRWMISKGGEPIIESESMVGLTSPPQLDIRGGGLMSGSCQGRAY